MFIRSYENGILTEVNNETNMYLAMKNLIENQDLCVKFSKNSVEINDILDINIIAEKWIQIASK